MALATERARGSHRIVPLLRTRSLDRVPGSAERIMADKPPNQSRTEHREAVRLSWKSRHIPVGTLLILGLVLACVLSAIFMVVAQGPSNPIP